MRYLFILLFVALIFSGCENSSEAIVQQTVAPAVSPTPSISPTTPQTPNIKFEVSSFNLDYKKDDSTYFDEQYSGDGIITASGDEELVKKSYLVLLSVVKTSGGDERTVNGTVNVVVSNGIGKFSTSDYNFDKSKRMEKPTYDLKVIGYIPYIDILRK